MARVKKKHVGRLQRIIDAEAMQAARADAINPFAAQHGDYERLGVMMVNRGGTPVARWKAASLLSESQLAAIAHCERLWGMLNGKALVMDLMRIPGQPSGNGWAEQEALDDLARMKGYIPAKYWSVFESVCRFDEPAGYAGSRIATHKDEQAIAARLIVQFVADTIAMKERLSY